MGVGTFSDDFNGTGKTFIVDGPLADTDDFDAYVKQQTDDGEEALSFEELAQEQYEDFEQFFRGVVENAGAALKMDSEIGRFDAVFDDEFSVELSSRFVQVASRSWETDLILAVGPGSATLKEWMESPEDFAKDIIEETGRTPAAFERMYMELVEDVSDHVRLTLMAENIECRYKTSSYTSSAYTLDADNGAAELTTLSAKIAATNALMSIPARDVLVAATRSDRIELAKAIHDANSKFGEEKSAKITVPVYDAVADRLTWYSPYEEYPQAQGPIPDDVRAFMLKNGAVGEMNPIPRCDDTESFFHDWQAKRPGFSSQVAISATEFIEANGEPFNLMFNQSDWIVEVEHAAEDARAIAAAAVNESHAGFAAPAKDHGSSSTHGL